MVVVTFLILKFVICSGLFDQTIHMRDKVDTAAILKDLTPKVCFLLFDNTNAADL